MIIPYRVDVPMVRVPWANYLIILGCTGAFIWQKYFITLVQEEYLDLMVLKGWQPWGFIGHLWRLGGYLHLLNFNATAAEPSNSPDTSEADPADAPNADDVSSFLNDRCSAKGFR